MRAATTAALTFQGGMNLTHLHTCAVLPALFAVMLPLHAGATDVASAVMLPMSTVVADFSSFGDAPRPTLPGLSSAEGEVGQNYFIVNSSRTARLDVMPDGTHVLSGAPEMANDIAVLFDARRQHAAVDVVAVPGSVPGNAIVHFHRGPDMAVIPECDVAVRMRDTVTCSMSKPDQYIQAVSWTGGTIGVVRVTHGNIE